MTVAENTEEEEEVEEEEEEVFHPKVRWAIPQSLEHMAFVGKDVLAVAHDVYILFMNLRTGMEVVYRADGPERGDGVDVIAGHRSNIFAFTEKVRHARIFIAIYPSFQLLIELKDKDVNRYKGLCLMEGELIAGLSGFPDYLITVWSWRLNQRLLCVPTGIVRRQQLFIASRMHMLVCQSYGQGMVVWEVAPCFRRCFLMRRNKDECGTWDIPEPALVSACWTNEGFLYACDAMSNVFAVASDGINMVSKLEWNDEDIEGTSPSLICAFGSGILLYACDHKFRWLKKVEPKPDEEKPKEDAKVKWRVAWERFLEIEDEVLRLTSSAAAEVAAAWTRAGSVLRLTMTQANEDFVDMRLFTYKQRNITKVKLIAPDSKFVICMNDVNEMCIYEVMTAKLVLRKYVSGTESSFQVSSTEPLVALFGANGTNYGMALYEWSGEELALTERAHVCLTHQHISRVVFSPTGRELIAAAMSAGHIFVYQVTPAPHYKLQLVRYTEVGRGLADCFLMKVGPDMRAFALVLFSDKFILGERIICVNAVTGKDNKFAGKMKGPYCRLLPLSVKDTMLAIPYSSRDYHILKLSGEKGVTVAVKIGEIVDSKHDLKQFSGMRAPNALLTFGMEGNVLLRRPDGSSDYIFKLIASHRYESGVRYAAIDAKNRVVVHTGRNNTMAVTFRNGLRPELQENVHHEPVGLHHYDPSTGLNIFNSDEKNYLDIQEEKKVREEAMDYKEQREEVVRSFTAIQKKLVELLEENIAERPLHQLSLSEFNLHLEFKKDRLKQAEKEREEIRLNTEARIRAQDKVTAWIKKTCWDTMLTPRVKIFAIFSHYQVENFPVLPSQRINWPELQQVEQLRLLEMENDADVFRPWEEIFTEPSSDKPKTSTSLGMMVSTEDMKGGGSEQQQVLEEEIVEGEPYVLSGTGSHKIVTVPAYMIPQTLAFSFLQMNMLYQIVKSNQSNLATYVTLQYNVQNVRLWFNKQFDELMAAKKRECGLVVERNTRLRFILEELNKLSDLRGSFHHMMIQIHDPVWRQEEEPIRLTRVLVEECTIPPWKSHISLPPPELKPKDDFRERALNEMMDGVLEKLWHEEIKKLIPKPQCMLDKEPEHWNEDDLRLVFDYEAKVRFRNEEREKYRKMLHAEYAKLCQVLNEGIVKFNMRVKELWLTKLKADSVIGQENLNLMRLRRANLDRVESAERLEDLRATIAQYEKEAEVLTAELVLIKDQSSDCQAAYDALAAKDRQMDRSFKNQVADNPPIVIDQAYKFFKKRPKWHQRSSMIPVVLYELANSIATSHRPPLLHPDCVDYFKGVEQLDQISNMPAIMDEVLWATMCRLRRLKIENEIRMRALILEAALVESTVNTWNKALQARRTFLLQSASKVTQHREAEHLQAINRTIQLVLPAGQVEITTTGHMDDFDDAALMPRDDVEEINKLIMRVGAIKLRLLRRQIEFRKAILAKEWEHAQMKMKLRHMLQELYTYGRLKVVKELQWFLKNKEKGYTDEDDYKRLEKEMAATKMTVERVLQDSAIHAEEMQMKITQTKAAAKGLDILIDSLHLKVSAKRVKEDALEPIRIRRIFKKRMETVVARSCLVREVQANHTRIVLMQTELELLRLKTYPTLASFQTFC